MDDNAKLAKQYAQRYVKLVAALDKAIEQGPWDQGKLLTNIGKRLRDFRDRIDVELDIQSQLKEDEGFNHLATRVARRSGHIKVFVSLYCMQGGRLRNWESVLQTLSRTINTRPIYRNEADVKAMIRAKTHQENEAYIAVYIRESQIAKHFTGYNPKDKLGHELVVLKEAGIDLNNITCFTHANVHYELHDGLLAKKDKTDPV